MDVSQMNGSLSTLMSNPNSQLGTMQIMQQLIESLIQIQAADGIDDVDGQWVGDCLNININVSVKIDLTGLTERKDDQLPAPSAAFPSTEAVEECRDMIRSAINELFQHSKFHNDTLMTKSPLHSLTVVKEACQTFMREQKIVPRTLCRRDKAVILRHFLIKYLNDCLRPTSAAKEATPDIKDEWYQYLVLHRQYVEGWSRQEVSQELSKLDLLPTDRRYKQALQDARERLSTIIWQREMWRRKDRKMQPCTL